MIRPMRPDDASAVAGLIRDAFAAIPVRLDPAPSALRMSGADVAHQLQTGGGAVWEEEGLRGCVLWRPVEHGLYLGRLAVAPAWQGRGIARLLVAAVEQEARRLQSPRLLLEVRLALDANRRLFAACGFRETALHCHPGYPEPTYATAEKPIVLPSCSAAS